MEKKGNILTQLALISDLFEKANMDADGTDVTFSLSQKEFGRLFNLFSSNANSKLEIIDDTFTVKIGVVEYIFTNKSSV